MRGLRLALLLSVSPVAGTAAQAIPQVQPEEYTRYELLAPGSARFRIYYDVSATRPGARFYFNPIRKGSEASDEKVVDRSTGLELRFEIVDGATVRAEGDTTADLETRYIKVELPRPVPPMGEVRLLIDKTYRDPKSYIVDGDEIVFVRSLGILRNSVVLPVGYELIGCNVPSQVLAKPDGRIYISFINPGPAEAPLRLKARKLP